MSLAAIDTCATASATSVAIVGTLGGIILLVFTLIIYSIIIGIKGSIWKQLKQNTNN